jgi:hypothetical protein
MSGQPDLLVVELGLHINLKENGLRKLALKFECDPMVGSKVIAMLTHY